MNCGRAIFYVSGERILGGTAQRDDALFVAFATHQDVSHFELQVFELYSDNFRYSQGPCIERLQHGAVAQRNRDGFFSIRSLLRALKDGFHLRPCQRFGQDFPLFGRVDVQRRIVGDGFVQQQIFI